MGLRVRTYCPVGDLVAGHELPRAPAAREHVQRLVPAQPRRAARTSTRCCRAVSNFTNEPLLELRRAPVRETLVDALAALDAQLPWRVPVIVGGERRDEPTLRSHDPGAPDRVVARGDRRDDRRRRRRGARRRARRAGVGGIAAPTPAPRSSRAPPASCAAAARRSPRSPSASARSRGRRPTPTSARRSTSSSTTRSRRSRSRARTASSSCPGERNTLRYAARGVVAVVGPWNFPLAIPAGMVAAGLATGNGVVLKPAEQSPACALAVVEALHAAGVPPGGAELPPRRGRRRRGARRPPGRAHDRVHRLRRRRPGDPAHAPPSSRPASATSSASWPRWAARTA